MVSTKYNIMVMGVSCFDGMASSEVRNLIEPLVNKSLVTAHNLIYQKDNEAIGKNPGSAGIVSTSRSLA